MTCWASSMREETKLRCWDTPVKAAAVAWTRRIEELRLRLGCEAGKMDDAGKKMRQ